MRYTITSIIALLFLFACKKDKDPYDLGTEEAKKIETTLSGKKYVIEKMVDEQGADVSASFPACIANDTFFLKGLGELEIKAGNTLCGKEQNNIKKATWNIAWNQDRSVKGIDFPVFTTGMDYYTEQLFTKDNYILNFNTGQLQLVFPANGKKYIMALKQIP